eukprot:925749-Rhodomonas_salina.1
MSNTRGHLRGGNLQGSERVGRMLELCCRHVPEQDGRTRIRLLELPFGHELTGGERRDHGLRLQRGVRCSCDRGYDGADWGTCAGCDPGKYKDITGSSPCLDCSAGGWNPQYAQTACADCPVNSRSREPGAWDVYNCTSDPVFEGPGHKECYACNYGYYKDTGNGTVACVLCDENQLSTATAAYACVNKSDFCTRNDLLACVKRYAEQYGCLADSVELLETEECFLSVGTLGDCLETACSGCDCGADPVDSGCTGKCGVDLPTYPSPGCPAESIGDGKCDSLCMRNASLFDGGDCIRDMLENFRVLFDSLDGDHPCPGCITYNATAALEPDEYALLSVYLSAAFPADAGGFSEIDVDGSGGLDMYELALFRLIKYGPTIDEFLQGQTAPRYFGMQAAATALMVHGDTSRNGVLDPDELCAKFAINATTLKFVGQAWQGVSSIAVLETLNTVILGLAGYLPPMGVNVETPLQIVFKLADHSRDLELNFRETGILLFSKAVFGAVDADASGRISLPGLRAAFKTSTHEQQGACSGYQQWDQRSGALTVQLPAIPPPPCTVLVLPGRHFARPQPAVQGQCSGQAELRRRRHRAGGEGGARVRANQRDREASAEESSRARGISGRRMMRGEAEMASGVASRAAQGESAGSLPQWSFLAALEAYAAACDVERFLYGDAEGEVACQSVAPPWGLPRAVLARTDADMDGAVDSNETCLDAASLVDDAEGTRVTLADVQAYELYVLDRELAVVQTLVGSLWDEADADNSVLLPDNAATAPNCTDVDARLQGLNQTWCDVTLSQHWTDILAGGNATNCSLISAASIDSLSSRISNLVASLQEWAQCTPASGSTTNSTRRLLAVRDEDLVRRFLRPGEAYTYCAARLIQPEWVMTAARCVAGESASVVAADRVVFHGGDESACGGGKAAIAE